MQGLHMKRIRSFTRKTIHKYCTTPLTWGSESDQSHRGRKQNDSWQGLRRGKGQTVFKGQRVSALWNEKVLRMDGGDGYSTVENTSWHRTVIWNC